MDEFVIKSSVDDCSLQFLPPGSGGPSHWRVRVTHHDLDAEARVYAGKIPTAWLQSLARDWQGWDDERTCRLGGDDELILSARHDHRGHIVLGVELWSGLTDHDWCVRATVVIEAGQLEQLGRNAERFFGNEHCV